MEVIARIENDFIEKFGIPRQSGITEKVISKIVFEPEFRIPEAIRGLEQFSHIWILWQFSEIVKQEFRPTVRPPRLGGNVRMGVFATRSPFRPNSIGLSSVKIEKIEHGTDRGDVIYVSGADIMNNTPVIDIKPYLPYTDCHTDASNGFALASKSDNLLVDFPDSLINIISPDKREGLISVLAQNPIPQYQSDPKRVYSMKFADYDISFTTDGLRLTVTSVKTEQKQILNIK